jgi:hypothetical protein
MSVQMVAFVDRAQLFPRPRAPIAGHRQPSTDNKPPPRYHAAYNKLTTSCNGAVHSSGFTRTQSRNCARCVQAFPTVYSIV